MFKQIDRCEDERLNMPLRETVQPHRQQRHDEICCEMRERCCEEDVACCFCVGGCWYVVCVCFCMETTEKDRKG